MIYIYVHNLYIILIIIHEQTSIEVFHRTFKIKLKCWSSAFKNFFVFVEFVQRVVWHKFDVGLFGGGGWEPLYDCEAS